MTLPLTFVPKLAKKARLRFDRHSQKHLLVYPERGLELNDSAAAIAQRCDGSRTIEAIVDELVREFDGAGDGDGDGAANRDVIQADVLTFVADLLDKGLLVR